MAVARLLDLFASSLSVFRQVGIATANTAAAVVGRNGAARSAGSCQAATYARGASGDSASDGNGNGEVASFKRVVCEVAKCAWM